MNTSFLSRSVNKKETRPKYFFFRKCNEGTSHGFNPVRQGTEPRIDQALLYGAGLKAIRGRREKDGAFCQETDPYYLYNANVCFREHGFPKYGLSYSDGGPTMEYNMDCI
jgi:hypothetical protein